MPGRQQTAVYSRMWVAAGIAFAVLVLAFVREFRNAAAIRRPSVAEGGPAIREQTELARFDGPLSHFEASRGFDDFLRAHLGEVVALDVEIARHQFEGDRSHNQWWFVLFDSCSAALEAGERPSAPKCSGTSYHVDDRPGGQASLKLESGKWRLRGLFRVDAAGGPQQGLMWVHLAPTW